MANYNSSNNGRANEQEMQQEIFNQILMTFLKGYPQARFRPFLIFVAEGKRVDLYDLSARVRILGSYQAITKKGKWGEFGPGALLWAYPEARLCQVLEAGREMRSGRVEANNDVLASTLEWIRCVAMSLRRGLWGWSYGEKWVVECFKRVERARLLVFNGVDHQQYSQKKQKIHPTYDKELVDAKSQDLDIQMINEIHVLVYEFHQLAHCPSSCVASSLLGVHTRCDMASSIPIDHHQMEQHSQKLLTILNVTAGYGFSSFEHISRKKVSIGPKF